MTQPNTNPSPKARFIALKTFVDDHRELIGRKEFQFGLDVSLAQMIWTHSAGGDSALSVSGNNAAERFYRLQGAQEFIRVLKTLAEASAPLPPQDTGDISHTFK